MSNSLRKAARSVGSSSWASSSSILAENLPLRTLAISDEEAELIHGAPLLTRRPFLVIANVSEDQVGNAEQSEEIRKRFGVPRFNERFL